MAQSIARQLPLRIGTAEEFAQVRSAFQAASFDEQTVLNTLKVRDMSDVGSVDWDRVDFGQVSRQFELFARLFLALRPVPRAELKPLSNETVAALFSLDLLNTGALENGDCYSSVFLYPIKGFWMVSDRFVNPDGSKFAPSDAVFPAIYEGTLRFLRLFPASPAEEALDLCAGTGIGAFVLSRYHKRTVSSDLTERATHFADFNRKLNDLANVDIVCGDLFAPVKGQTFDRIVAHPPYVPSLTDATIWRDGGTTGERLVKRIIEGLPDHLRPGGIFCLLSLGIDTREGRFEERARAWLKKGADEFDIIFASTDERTPKEILRELVDIDGGIQLEERQRLREAFEEAGIVRMPKGVLVMRRHGPADHHQAWTVRAKLSETTNGLDLERTFADRPRFLNSSFIRELVKNRPVLAPGLEVKVTHVVHNGELVPAKFIFETDKPFNFSVQVDGWMVPLFARFDGKLTPEEVYNAARENAETPEEFTLDDFDTLVARMIERGFLRLPDIDYNSLIPTG